MHPLYLCLMLILLTCKNQRNGNGGITPREQATNDTSLLQASGQWESAKPIQNPKSDFLPDYDTVAWAEVVRMEPSIVLDLRYATEHNFVGEKMYDCPRCFLRPEVAKAVVSAHRELQKEGLGLKMYDCYRPRPVQWKLWNKVPDPKYVADPRKGSMHNRGLAVDLTIVDLQGNELDMGTEYDFFGLEAYHDYYHLPEQILNNRKRLFNIMAKNGLEHTRTEWWHYSMRIKGYPLDDWVWPCR